MSFTTFERTKELICNDARRGSELQSVRCTQPNTLLNTVLMPGLLHTHIAATYAAQAKACRALSRTHDAHECIAVCKVLRGVTVRERWREPRFAPVPLALAHLLLFHRRLDGYLHTTRAPVGVAVPVKIRCESERSKRFGACSGTCVPAP